MADGELKLMISKLADLVESERTENAKFRTEVRERLNGIDKRLDGIDIRLAGIDKRQDDQNAILAALIPAKIAAVGR